MRELPQSIWIGLPEQLERQYGLYAARLLGEIHTRSVCRLDSSIKSLTRRMDAEGEIQEEDIPDEVKAAFLAAGISLAALLDEDKLREVLRRIANKVDQRQKRALSAALGKDIKVSVVSETEAWVEAQVEAIQGLIAAWTAEVTQAASNLETPTPAAALTAINELGEKKSKLKKAAFAAATGAILALNAELIATNAVGSGIQHYRWRTTLDGKERAWHRALDGSIERFDLPPLGGGTTSADPGHPGSGRFCRCLSELIP